MAGSHIRLTAYATRHCRASTAKGRNAPIATISEARGNGSATATRIRLTPPGTSVVDDANSEATSLAWRTGAGL